ncbi:hypothetical protein MKJ04_11455 [Pontibacter sp. E15-1]|uniref:hypothetical protein n=1 Tax=Pontibacter sp. E15-1 TaxID=2919918 RepID=UPI001F4F47CC|nr:hypothetical protein [Pontibacter sp. E15-1]MCJ8165460.1 hypothetical protein [Pontibacter sp. E15-1]
MENPTPQHNNIPCCQACQHWNRRTSEQYHQELGQWVSRPTKFGYCSSKPLYREKVDIVTSTNKGQELFTEDEELYDLENLDVELFTHEDFGCVCHQVAQQ